MEKPRFSGWINKVFSEEDKYSFYYDGKKLNLILLDDKGLRFGYSKQEPFLLANRSVGGTIGLYKCVCKNDVFDDTATIHPSMIYIPKNINSSEVNFNRLLFKGKLINQLFPPIQKVKYDSARDLHKPYDGSKTIELKSFEETDVNFSAKINDVSYNCRFGVYVPGSINEGDDNLGELISYFEIDFEEVKHIKEILPLYSTVRKFFQFLAKQKDISFDEVQVGIKNEQGKFETIGYFIDNTLEQKELNIKFNIKKFLPNIGEFFSKIAENELNYNYIPKDNFESKYITPESYIKVCGAFEHNYELLFKTLPNRDKYKLDTIAYINKVLEEKLETEKLGKKYKEYFEHISDVLNKDLNSVATQFNRCLKHYKTAVEDFLQHVIKRYELKDEKSLGVEFSSFRNKDAHGGFIEFTNFSVCAFIVSLVLIECMILEESKYSLEEIKNIINERYL